MRGKRVEVVVDGERRVGTVVSLEYTVKGGEPVAVVELDSPVDGREKVAAEPDELSPCA